MKQINQVSRIPNRLPFVQKQINKTIPTAQARTVCERRLKNVVPSEEVAHRSGKETSFSPNLF